MGRPYSFYEFFAGGGMARAGLGAKWRCLFANDSSAVKVKAYTENWGDDHLDDGDIHDLDAQDLPGYADLAWASFPCQDLSVAGAGLGIGKSNSSIFTRSGALWSFFRLISALRREDRSPPIIVLENVVGLLTLAGGRDFAAVCTKLGSLGFRFGAVIVDASYFVPQSRPRVFLIAIDRRVELPAKLVNSTSVAPWHPAVLTRAHKELTPNARKNWLWWNLGSAPSLSKGALLKAISLDGEVWNSQKETKRLLSMMTDLNSARLKEARASAPAVGSLYLRMRRQGKKNKQRAEVAFGSTLGCLRTPRGGGSRPRIVVVEKRRTRTRLLTAREAATLMGLQKDYVLPGCYEHAFQLIGDGVAVPVVSFLNETLLTPLTSASRKRLSQPKGRQR